VRLETAVASDVIAQALAPWSAMLRRA
jgi:hypothetical protein